MSKNSNSKEDEAPPVASKAEAEETEPLVPNAVVPASPAKTNSNGCVVRIGVNEGGKVVILNVGGQRHEALKKNFDKFPQTRLWKAMRATTVEEILRHCDRYRVTEASGGVPEYFFDRNYTSFVNLLDAYRIGRLHLNATNCAILTRDDLNYWGIDELLIEPCCAVKYYPEMETCENELFMEEDENSKEATRAKEEDFGQTKLGRLRKTLWDLFEYPSTSKGAQFIACFSLLMIIVSTACFILSCIVGEDAPAGAWSIGGDHDQQKASNITNPEFDIVDKKNGGKQNKTVSTIIMFVDYFTAVFFTIEYFTRLATCPKKMRFFVQPMNLVDLFAILPYFVNFIVDHLSEFHIIGKAGKVVRLVRVTKILRVFKLVRHFAGLQSLFFTIRKAARELGLLVMLIGVSVLTFSSLIYFAEKDDGTNNWTFLDSFWWGLLTMTTVGSGTEKPQTGAGKLVGAMCAVMGIFSLILPIPIVVNSFAAFYRNRLWRSVVEIKRKERSTTIEEIKVDGANDIGLNGLEQRNS